MTEIRFDVLTKIAIGVSVMMFVQRWSLDKQTKLTKSFGSLGHRRQEKI